MRRALAALAALLAAAPPAAAAPGDIDRSFGVRGTVLLPGTLVAVDVVALERRIVVGAVGPVTANVLRHGGRFDVAAERGLARAMPPLPQPRALVASGPRHVVLQTNSGLARVSDTGAVDTTFAGELPPSARTVTLAPAPRGGVWVGADETVQRRDVRGRLVAGFGGSGSVAVPAFRAGGLAAFGDGLLLAGQPSGFARLSARASWFPISDPLGVTPHDIPHVASGPRDTAAAVGVTAKGTLSVARLRIGDPVPPLRRVSDVRMPDGFVNDVVLDRRGRILVAHQSGTVTRLTPGGRRDRSFGTDGTAFLPVDERLGGSARALAIDSRDRIHDAGSRVSARADPGCFECADPAIGVVWRLHG